MRFAIDLHTTEDWGGGPTYSTEYIYEDYDEAVDDAHELMIKWQGHAPEEWIGCYVVSDDGEDASPSVEDLVTLRDGILYIDGEAA